MRNWQLSALLQSIIVLFWSLKVQFSSLKASSSVQGFFSHSVASLPVSITTRAKCQHPAADWGLGDPQWSSFGREEFPVACPVSSCSLFEMLLWTDIHGSPLVVSVKAALNVSIGIDKHVNRSLAGREACTVQAQAMNLHTPGSAVHLTCRWWRGRWRGSSRFNYSFFFALILTSSHHSRSPRGAERSRRSLSSGSGLATRSSGLQKNSYSLWHALRRSIISLLLILSRALSPPLSPVRSVFTARDL